MTRTQQNAEIRLNWRNAGPKSVFNLALLERGMSVAELARRIGADKKRLWYILNGQREMRVDEFLKLCVALKIDPRSFVTQGTIKEVAEATRMSMQLKGTLHRI